jgi:hypothetical protein
MAWASMPSFTDGAILTGAQMAILVGNLNATAAGVATTAGRVIVVTGANAVAERALLHDTVDTLETTAATSYTDLATVGPTVTVAHGAQALAMISARVFNSTSGAFTYTSIGSSGANVITPLDTYALEREGTDRIRATSCHKFTALTPGTTNFIAKYKVGSGTGSWMRRELIMMAL